MPWLTLSILFKLRLNYAIRTGSSLFDLYTLFLCLCFGIATNLTFFCEAALQTKKKKHVTVWLFAEYCSFDDNWYGRRSSGFFFFNAHSKKFAGVWPTISQTLNNILMLIRGSYHYPPPLPPRVSWTILPSCAKNASWKFPRCQGNQRSLAIFN